jgi:hypothetical protein
MVRIVERDVYRADRGRDPKWITRSNAARIRAGLQPLVAA